MAEKFVQLKLVATGKEINVNPGYVATVEKNDVDAKYTDVLLDLGNTLTVEGEVDDIIAKLSQK